MHDGLTIPGSLICLSFSLLHGHSARVQKYKPFIKLTQGHCALFEPVRGNRINFDISFLHQSGAVNSCNLLGCPAFSRVHRTKFKYSLREARDASLDEIFGDQY